MEIPHSQDSVEADYQQKGSVADGKVPHDTEGFGMVRNDAATFGSVPHNAERFGTIPHPSEGFGKVPQGAEAFGNLPKSRSENHILTVREAVRLFEAANVARSERSIVNWCQPNRQGIARLDAYYDPNERRYYITPQSVEAVIAEERAKATRNNHSDSLPHDAATFGNHPATESESASEATRKDRHESETEESTNELDELRRENRDLHITNRAKDLFIDQLKLEREKMLDQLAQTNRQIGVLETKLLQIEEHG